LCAIVKIDTLNARAWDEEGFCNFYAGNYKKSALLFDSAAFIWKKVNRVSYCKSLNDKANALMYNSEYHKALLTFFECLDISNEIHDKKLTGKLFNNIGLVYESIGDPDNALLYEKKSLVYKFAAKDTLSIARTYGNIGNAFDLKELPDSAIFYEKRSYKLYALESDKEGMSNSLGDIGAMYYKKHIIDSAISYMLRALPIALKLSSAENIANFENDLAHDYLKKNDLKQAQYYALMAAAYVPQITDYDFLQNHYT